MKITVFRNRHILRRNLGFGSPDIFTDYGVKAGLKTEIHFFYFFTIFFRFE